MECLSCSVVIVCVMGGGEGDGIHVEGSLVLRHAYSIVISPRNVHQYFNLLIQNGHNNYDRIPLTPHLCNYDTY